MMCIPFHIPAQYTISNIIPIFENIAGRHWKILLANTALYPPCEQIKCESHAIAVTADLMAAFESPHPDCSYPVHAAPPITDFFQHIGEWVGGEQEGGGGRQTYM